MANAAQPQRRSLKSVVLTQKHHIPFMGLTMSLSLGLLMVLYGLVLFEIFDVAQSGADVPVFEMVLIASTMICILGMGVIGSGILAAHRVAGVYIKLKQVFERVERGDLDAELRFRAEDRLAPVEDSFERMMATIRREILPVKEDSSL